AAEQGVVAGPADQNVVTSAAVSSELDRTGGEPRGLDHAIAGKAVDNNAIHFRLKAGDVDLSRQTKHRDAALISDDHHHIVAARRVDDDRVCCAVAEAV